MSDRFGRVSAANGSTTNLDTLQGTPPRIPPVSNDVHPTAIVSLYWWTAVSTGNTFQDLPRLRNTADNTERYI
jgi:hypothetical protein